MTTETMTMTLTYLKEAAKRRGYIVKKTDGEIEIYPKGKRGDASYFTNDTNDAFSTMRADFASRQAERIKNVTREFDIHPLLPAEECLIQYAVASGRSDWTNRLFDDWYRACSTTVDRDTYSVLHRLRNHRDGYEMVRRIAESK
jgi:hypothetical protein